MRPNLPMRRSAALLAAWLLAAPGTAQERPALIAAAADLKFALAEIARAFTRETGRVVRMTYGSSGDLARQIGQGAPFEVFMSADERYALELHRAGLTRDAGVAYAVGRLALFAPHASSLTVDPEFRGLREAASDGRLTRFAIPNPEHAPYGRAAREALETLGLWRAVQPALVFGENASQAMQFAASGSCQGGIVPLSLATAPVVSKLGTFQPIPAEWHTPLRQRMVLVKRAGPVAAAFFDFVRRSDAAKATFARFGYGPPDGR
jgi:molybdate transport system substrate-binding protein